MNIELYNEDCMEGMKRYPDKWFDLAIVDPPYGENVTGGYTTKNNQGAKRSNSKAYQKIYYTSIWDNKRPDNNYFTELQKISINQIIWGGNYFVDFLLPSSGWIYWNKLNGDVKFSDGELAYTSFKKGLRQFDFRWQGMLQHDMKNKEARIHPTQKPVALYKWLLKNYAKPGDKILDTHLGSGSIAIACYDMGFDLAGFEIDKDYFDAMMKRFNNHKAQLTLF